MEIKLHTTVEKDYQEVFSGFNKDLFIKLLPSFPKMRLLRFDGCQKGDQVHLSFKLFGTTQRWESEIIEENIGQNENYFIDQGIKLPFFLVYWEHTHRISRQSHGTLISDEIFFRSANFLTDLLLYPILFQSFMARKRIYKKYFRKSL